MVDNTKFELTLEKVLDELNKTGIHNNVVKVYLFGSYAKGTYGSKSDIDLFFIFEDKYYFERNNHRAIRIYTQREFYDPETMPVELDIHFSSESQFDNNDVYMASIIKDTGKIIWENKKEHTSQ